MRHIAVALFAAIIVSVISLDFELRSAEQVAVEGSFSLGTSVADATACAVLCDESDVCFSFDYGDDLTCNGNYNRDVETETSSVYSHYEITKTSLLPPEPVLLYEFNDLTETISGGDPKYTLIAGTDEAGNAPTITDGVLTCDGVDDYLHSAYNLDFYLQDHSLEALLKLSNLDDNGAACPFSIDAGYTSDDPDAAYTHKGFDAIVYDERSDAPNTWLAGSEGHQRTQTITNADTETSLDWIHVVITYDTYNQLVTIYRNGEQYGDSFTPTTGALVGSNFLTIDPTSAFGVRPVICHRHTNGGGLFGGSVDYVALYDRALSAEEVGILYEDGPHIPFERTQCEDDTIYSNTDLITSSSDVLAYIPITNSMVFKFDVIINGWCSETWCPIFYVGDDPDNQIRARYPGVFLENNAESTGLLHISFSTEESGNPVVDVGPEGGLSLSTQYTIEIVVTQSTYSISFNGVVVYYDGSYANHCVAGDTCHTLTLPDDGLQLKIGGMSAYAGTLDGVVSNVLIRSTCEDICSDACNNRNWVEIATEDVGDTGSATWRFLDFRDDIYNNYPLCNIKQYKLEWGYSSTTDDYASYVTFELDDNEYYLFEDSLQSVNPSHAITILDSNVDALGEGSAYFCKACSTEYETQYGDSCWGVVADGDLRRGCGCNDGGWAGIGAFYGGWDTGPTTCGTWGGAFAGFTIDEGAKGGVASVGVRLSILVCDEDVDECESEAGGTLDWDALTEDGVDIPDMDYAIEIDEDDLSLHITVELEYMGLTSADDDETLWGSTYVLDFEDFDAHEDNIYEPGTCQNRLADSFTGRTFDDWWLYSSDLPQVNVGSDDYLAYPPVDGDKWSVYMDWEDECNTVIYDGHFTWNQLIACSSFGGDNYIDTIDGEKFINLTGVFYVNFVSPFSYESDTGYYRVYQLLSVPFTIAISKTVNVLSAAGINVLTMSVIAVYKEDGMNTFKLILLTESSDYLQLDINSDTGSYLVELYEGTGTITSGEFTVLETAVTAGETITDTPAGCLNNKAFICSQLWQISAENVECETKGVDFSGTYTLQFETSCRAEPDIEADLVTYCTDWLSEHPDIEDGVVLQADLTWRDDVCDPLLFKVQFAAEMLFFTDAAYSIEMDDYLFAVGEDTVYVQIDTGFPDDTYNVFDTQLTNVWLCTFDPLIEPDDPHDNMLEGGCFDIRHDGYEEGEDSKYYYHVYDNGVGDDDLEFENYEHPDDTDETKNQIQFKFKVPVKIARDKLYVHAQVEVSLQPEGRRRRQLLRRYRRAMANQMSHFMDDISLIQPGDRHYEPQPQQPQKRPHPHNYNVHHDQQPPPSAVPNTTWTVSLNSPWVLAIGGLLALVLSVNVCFMCYMNCCGRQQRARVSFNRARRSGYASVKQAGDSEFDESAAEQRALNADVSN